MILLLGVVAVLMIREPAGGTNAASSEAPTLKTFFAGISFIRRTPVMLGAITLDLFAVLFGGAVALLPLFARDILHTGPLGLGILRSAPARRRARGGRDADPQADRLDGRAGRCSSSSRRSASRPSSSGSRSRSRSRWPRSPSAGFVDMFSVNIRITIAIVAAPERAARQGHGGRVGLHQRLERARRVRVRASRRRCSAPSRQSSLGGVITIVLAGVWRWVFPDLAKIDEIEELRPDPTMTPEAAL